MKNLVTFKFLLKTFCDSICTLMGIYSLQSLVSRFSVVQQDSFMMNSV